MTQSNTEDKYATLSPVVAIACATVLEDAIDQLTILGKIGDLPTVSADFTQKTPEERFGSYVAEVQVFDPETIEPYEESMKKAKYVNFQTDRSYIETVLGEVMKSLVKSGSYGCLIDHINQHNANVKMENDILETHKENLEMYHGLEENLERQREESLVELQQLSKSIGKLKDQIEDLKIENAIKLNYVKNWEEARLDQNNYALDHSEASYTRTIEDTKSDIEKEIRINVEIESFITETEQDYAQQIQYWMDRYDNEIEARDTEIQVLKEKREEQFNRLQELSLIYEKRKEEIEAYLVLKEKRRLVEEARLRRLRACIKLQAWWRGVMVRRCLGPFKKKSAPSKKKK
ncbi:dynein regulatory complex protein 9 [Photinus pyralis]|nr:dynein regulatory complex protein 9 [Photinus pyralis]